MTECNDGAIECYMIVMAKMLKKYNHGKLYRCIVVIAVNQTVSSTHASRDGLYVPVWHLTYRVVYLAAVNHGLRLYCVGFIVFEDLERLILPLQRSQRLARRWWVQLLSYRFMLINVWSGHRIIVSIHTTIRNINVIWKKKSHFLGNNWIKDAV